jgi:hypothetical protein
MPKNVKGNWMHELEKWLSVPLPDHLTFDKVRPAQSTPPPPPGLLGGPIIPNLSTAQSKAAERAFELTN